MRLGFNNGTFTGRDILVMAACGLALTLAGCGQAEDAGSSAKSSADSGAANWNGGGTTGGETTGSQGADAGTASEDTTNGGWGTNGGTTGETTGETTGGGSGTGTTTGGNPNVGENGECMASCLGKQCGPDGCGGTCGWCSGDMSCQAGACTDVAGCTPACAGAMVGEADGCGGVCSGSGFGIGLVPGGAQDADYFKSQVLAGQIPDAALLPIEGWLNQHGTALPAPLYDRLVTLHGFVGLFYDPAVGEPTVALQLGMNSGLSPDAIEEGKFNLSVVVDRSGSMNGDGKIEFVREGLLEMLDSLDGDDLLSVVVYSTTAKVALPPTPVNAENLNEIIAVIKAITPGGKTNLAGGLKLGYEQVMKNIADKSRTPRVILLSDGIANEGITDEGSILTLSNSYNDAGVGVTTIGVGQDLNFSLLHLLASQGNGNFYFLDDAEKLSQVFSEEIKYLLTPVADNLKLWFSLPDGFGVEDVYGFEYKEKDGEFHLLGPSPQYTVSGGEVVEEPPAGGGEEPNVAISTVFASKKNGLLMIKLQSPSGNKLQDFEDMTLSTVYYSYELAGTGEVEAFDTDINVGPMAYDTEGGYHYFSGAIMQKNFCVLRAGLAMKTAVTLFNEDPEGGLQGAITQLAQAKTFCTGINVQLNDTQLVEDLALIGTLMDNICEAAGCEDPAGQ